MKKYLVILNLFLIPAILYFGVKAFYRTMTAQLDHTPMPQAVSQSVVSSQNETRHPLSFYNPITERNLFNTKDREVEKPKEEPKEEESKELKETELKVALWGTVSGNKNRAYAVIEDKKERKQNLYREGDMIQDAIVKKILREQVILSVNNKDEILKMAEKKIRSPGKPKFSSEIERKIKFKKSRKKEFAEHKNCSFEDRGCDQRYGQSYENSENTTAFQRWKTGRPYTHKSQTKIHIQKIRSEKRGYYYGG